MNKFPTFDFIKIIDGNNYLNFSNTFLKRVHIKLLSICMKAFLFTIEQKHLFRINGLHSNIQVDNHLSITMLSVEYYHITSKYYKE